MKQWIVEAMLVVFGIWLGAVLLPGDRRGGMQRQTVGVNAGARRCGWPARLIGSMRALRCLRSSRASRPPFSAAAAH